MQKRVQRKEVNLTIGGDARRVEGSPSPDRSFSLRNSEFPSADTLAEKYGVLEKGPSSPVRTVTSTVAGSPKKDFDMLLKLEEKNRKIEQLCVMLEALEPSPGVDPEKIRRAMVDGTEAEGVDFRDGKIVALAKKSHRLTMQLNKEKSVSDKLEQQLKQLRLDYESVNQQLALAKAMGGKDSTSKKEYNRHSQALEAQEDDKEVMHAAISSLKKDLKESEKAVDELKRKLSQSNDENKQLSRALSRELGDGVSLEQAVSGGWRGRAQQIVMLKAKIKKMEAEGASTTRVRSSGYGYGGTATGTGGDSPGGAMDVDAKAGADLTAMSNERRQVVEALTEERVSLMETNQQLERKVSGQKARITNLEGEVKKMKDGLQVVISKSENDDQLIEALRGEVQRLKNVAAAAGSNTSGGAGRSMAAGSTVMRGSVSAGTSRSNATSTIAGHSKANSTVRLGRRSQHSGDATSPQQQHSADSIQFSPDDAVIEQMEADIKKQETELLRLRRLCSNQAEQLDSQDITIRQLKKKLNTYTGGY